MHEGVYVPRWHTELVAERAAERLPDDGAAIDLCTGSGAIAEDAARAPPGRARDRERPRPNARSRARARTASTRTPGDLFAPLPDRLGPST